MPGGVAGVPPTIEAPYADGGTEIAFYRVSPGKSVMVANAGKRALLATSFQANVDQVNKVRVLLFSRLEEVNHWLLRPVYELRPIRKSFPNPTHEDKK
jgi:hypothetical protein